MRGTSGRRPYASMRGVQRLRHELSERDLAIVRQVADLRLMSARQIQAIHFPAAAHGNLAAATRARQRVVARLVRDRLLLSLERRIGGVRAGSAGLVLCLGVVGQRVLRLDGPRRRAYEPTDRFVDHSLSVSQLVVDAQLAAHTGRLDLLSVQSEPACWRVCTDRYGRSMLRPDLYLALGVGEYELRWFIEVDRATESLPTVLRKCRLYARYYQSGAEQAASGVFPRVCWVVPDDTRGERIRHAITRDQQLPAGLFVVTTESAVVNKLQAVN